MKTYTSSSALKARARGALTGHYLTLSGAFITLGILQYFIVAPSSLLQTAPPVGMILYYAANFALDLFFAIFQVGIAFLFLSNACGHPINSGGLFTGFWNNPGKAVQIQLVPSLVLLIPNVLPDILMNQFLTTTERKWLLYCLIVSLAFLPLTLYVRILYSQVFFVMLDFPEMTAPECLRQSRRLMKGNKGRYLYLMLSFIPLTILGVLSCGIGLFYVYPYREQTYANFYLDLIASKSCAQSNVQNPYNANRQA